MEFIKKTGSKRIKRLADLKIFNKSTFWLKIDEKTVLEFWGILRKNYKIHKRNLCKLSMPIL